MTSAQHAYDELLQRAKEASLLGSCADLLGWDQRVYMPRAGAGFRADQLSLLAGMAHQKITDPRIGELLATVEQSELARNGNPIVSSNIRELRHRYDRKTKLPQKLVEEISRVTSLAETEWEVARRDRDFKRFAPWLEQVVKLMRESADAYGWKGEPYNALLEGYEPGATVEDLVTVFEPLRQELVSLLEKIRNAPKRPDVTIVERKYDVELQRIFGEAVAAAIGFDFTAGRLDVTTHPFCSGIGTGDTRVTTRYNPNRLNDALFGIMHEVGHALYEMGLDKQNHVGTPAAEAVSLGVHESQSRTWENQVGRSKEFWVYFLPQAKRIFRQSLDGVTLEAFYGAINSVRPSYIRVEADECTYNLHILLRFELERAIVKGDLKVADIPHEWNSRFEKYFGIKVDHDSNGCLQDVHWSAGLMGYFPTYTLGNLYGAQFFAKAKKDIPDLMKQFERGEFSGLLGWLRENIHRHGSVYRAKELGQRVTGQALSHKPLIEYLHTKYREIYGIA